MTDASLHPNAFQRADEKTETVTLPAPVVFAPPVLISDAITPVAGETLLSLIFRRIDREH